MKFSMEIAEALNFGGIYLKFLNKNCSKTIDKKISTMDPATTLPANKKPVKRLQKKAMQPAVRRSPRTPKNKKKCCKWC